jgi:hypothetical protein
MCVCVCVCVWVGMSICECKTVICEVKSRVVSKNPINPITNTNPGFNHYIPVTIYIYIYIYNVECSRIAVRASYILQMVYCRISSYSALLYNALPPNKRRPLLIPCLKYLWKCIIIRLWRQLETKIAKPKRWLKILDHTSIKLDTNLWFRDFSYKIIL